MRRTATSSRPAATRTAGSSSRSTACCSPGPKRRWNPAVARAPRSAGRAHDWVSWRRVWWRISKGRLLRFAGGLRPPALRRRPTTEATVVSVTPLRLDADSRTLKEAVSLSRTGMRSIVVERVGSAESWNDVPIEVISLWPPAGPAVALDRRRGGAAAIGVERAAPARRRRRPVAHAGVDQPQDRDDAAGRPTSTGSTAWPSCPPWRWSRAYRGVPFVYDAHDFYSDSKNNDGPHLGRPLGHVGVRARRAPVRPLRGASA